MKGQGVTAPMGIGSSCNALIDTASFVVANVNVYGEGGNNVLVKPKPNVEDKERLRKLVQELFGSLRVSREETERIMREVEDEWGLY